MGTIVQSNTIEIDSTPDAVWAAVSDYGMDVVWRKGITEMTPDVAGAPRVGTRVVEVLELGGRAYTTKTTVTETGPMSYRFAGSGDSGEVRGGRSVRPGATPGSATFTYDVELEPAGIPRVLRPILARFLDRGMRRDLRTLRTLLENG